MAGRHATCVQHGQASDVGGTFRTTRDKHWTLTHPSIFWHNTLPIYNLLPCRKLLSTSLYSHYPTCTKEKKNFMTGLSKTISIIRPCFLVIILLIFIEILRVHARYLKYHRSAITLSGYLRDYRLEYHNEYKVN
jgi:hypothetical protein